MNTRHIHPHERDLVNRILAYGNGLYVQVPRDAIVEEIDADGSIRFFRDARTTSSPQKKYGIEAQFQDLDGTYVHALLFTLSGEIDELEIYKDDGTKISSLPPADRWELLELS